MEKLTITDKIVLSLVDKIKELEKKIEELTKDGKDKY